MWIFLILIGIIVGLQVH